MTADEVHSALCSLVEKKEPKTKAPLQLEATAQYLIELHNKYAEENEFKPGDLVQWKRGLQNKNQPANYGEPAVVVSIKPGNIDPRSDSGSPYFQERLDLLCAVIDKDGDFIVWPFDSSRMEPYTGPR